MSRSWMRIIFEALNKKSLKLNLGFKKIPQLIEALKKILIEYHQYCLN